MKEKIVLILVCLGLCLLGYSQNFKKSSKSLAKLNDPVIALYFIPQNEDVAKLTSITSNMGPETSGPYKGFDRTSFKQTLVFSNGEKFSFLLDETLVDLKGNSFVTKQPNDKNKNELIIRYYQLINRSSQLKGQTITELDCSVFLLNNGNVIITDEYEFYGRSIKFYDSSLKLISENEPFGAKGFSSSSFSETLDKINFAFKPVESNNERKKLVLITYSSSSGNILQKTETVLDEIKEPVIISNNDIFVIYENGRIVGLNKEGKSIWSKLNYFVVNMILINGSNDLAVLSNEEIILISINNGNVLWRHSFLELDVIKKTLDLSSFVIRPLEIKAVFNDSQISILLSSYNIKDILSDQPTFNNIFVLFDIQGTVVNQEIAIDKSHLGKICDDKNKIFILNENNIITYEKN